MNGEDGEASAKAVVEELQAQVHELQQKLNIAEAAIDKDGQLRAARDEVNNVKEVAKIDLREAEREKSELRSEHEEAVRRHERVEALEAHLAECCKELLRKQEDQFELIRL